METPIWKWLIGGVTPIHGNPQIGVPARLTHGVLDVVDTKQLHLRFVDTEIVHVQMPHVRLIQLDE